MARQREMEAIERYNAQRARDGVRPSRGVWTPAWSVLTGWGWLLVVGGLLVVALVVLAVMMFVR